MHLRNFVFMFMFVLHSACSYTTVYELPPPGEVVDTTVLVIEPGSQTDLALMGGSPDAELVRFDIVNISDRDVLLRQTHIMIQNEDGATLDAGQLTDVKLVNQTGRTLMGPVTPGEGGEILLNDELTLFAGSATTLILRADLGPSAGRYTVTISPYDQSTGGVVLFADTHEPVPTDDIENNRVIGRVISLFPASMIEDSTTALVATFTPEQGILNPGDGAWVNLGMLTLQSFGGDSVFRGMDVFGANIGLISSTTLAQDDRIVGALTTPISACSCGSVRLLEPVTVHDSERVQYEVWGMLSTDSYIGELTFGPNGSEIDAEASDGGAFSVIVSAPFESRFRAWSTHPVVSTHPLPTASLVNEVSQDLFRIQVSSAVPGEALHVGSLTFRIAGHTSRSVGSLSDLHIRIGSADLSPTQYRIVRTSTGETITREETLSTLHTEQITVVFTDMYGLLIIGSGHVLTLVGTPSGFDAGDWLRTRFGDYVFSSSVFSWGNMTVNGRITVETGDPGLVDPIIWRPEGTGGVYTGAWQIDDLTGHSTLTR